MEKSTGAMFAVIGFGGIYFMVGLLTAMFAAINLDKSPAACLIRGVLWPFLALRAACSAGAYMVRNWPTVWREAWN